MSNTDTITVPVTDQQVEMTYTVTFAEGRKITARLRFETDEMPDRHGDEVIGNAIRRARTLAKRKGLKVTEAHGVEFDRERFVERLPVDLAPLERKFGKK